MVSRIEHIGIIVPNLDASIRKYTALLGLAVQEIEQYDDGTERALLAFLPVGDSCLELIEVQKAAGPNSPRPGIEHLALEVPDIEEAYRTLRANGVTVEPDRILAGSRGTRVLYIKPADFDGVFIELVQPAPAKD